MNIYFILYFNQMASAFERITNSNSPTEVYSLFRKQINKGNFYPMLDHLVKYMRPDPIYCNDYIMIKDVKIYTKPLASYLLSFLSRVNNFVVCDEIRNILLTNCAIVLDDTTIIKVDASANYNNIMKADAINLYQIRVPRPMDKYIAKANKSKKILSFLGGITDIPDITTFDNMCKLFCYVDLHQLGHVLRSATRPFRSKLYENLFQRQEKSITLVAFCQVIEPKFWRFIPVAYVVDNVKKHLESYRGHINDVCLNFIFDVSLMIYLEYQTYLTEILHLSGFNPRRIMNPSSLIILQSKYCLEAKTTVDLDSSNLFGSNYYFSLDEHNQFIYTFSHVVALWTDADEDDIHKIDLRNLSNDGIQTPQLIRLIATGSNISFLHPHSVYSYDFMNQDYPGNCIHYTRIYCMGSGHSDDKDIFANWCGYS